MNYSKEDLHRYDLAVENLNIKEAPERRDPAWTDSNGTSFCSCCVDLTMDEWFVKVEHWENFTARPVPQKEDLFELNDMVCDNDEEDVEVGIIIKKRLTSCNSGCLEYRSTVYLVQFEDGFTEWSNGKFLCKVGEIT